MPGGGALPSPQQIANSLPNKLHFSDVKDRSPPPPNNKCFETSDLAKQELARTLASLLSRGQNRNLGTAWPGQGVELRCVLMW